MDNKDILNFKDIGARIRQARENLNLTREKFSEIIGLSSFYLGQIERGDRRMSLVSLARIATSLHLSVDYLLYGKDGPMDKLGQNIDFTIFENDDSEYNMEMDQNLREIFLILARCSPKETLFFKDLIKLILPYINRPLP